MIENLQDEIYQLESKQTKIFLTMPKKFLERTRKIEYAKSNNIWVTSTDDTNQNSSPKDIIKSTKKNYEDFHTKEKTSKAATTEFVSKIPYRKKISNENFSLCKVETSLGEIIKSTFSNK